MKVPLPQRRTQTVDTANGALRELDWEQGFTALSGAVRLALTDGASQVNQWTSVQPLHWLVSLGIGKAYALAGRVITVQSADGLGA